jgi:hypothetical protein
MIIIDYTMSDCAAEGEDGPEDRGAALPIADPAADVLPIEPSPHRRPVAAAETLPARECSCS